MGVVSNLFWLVVWAYFLGWLLFLTPAIWFPKRRKHKIVAAIIVTMAYHGPFAYFVYDEIKWKKKYPPAKALFDKLCTEAHGYIYKTAENVEGILLLDIRKGDIKKDNYDPYWPDAAFAKDDLNDYYIRSFLDRSFNHFIWWENGIAIKRKSLPNKLVGYAYVDVKEGEVFMRYKYDKEYKNGEKLFTNSLKKERSPQNLSRYAVAFVNDTNPEYRKHWIAGTTVTIIDTWTQEIMAQKTWYALQYGLGTNIGDGASSWSKNGIICPKLEFTQQSESNPYDLITVKYNDYITARFVNQILQPNQEY